MALNLYSIRAQLPLGTAIIFASGAVAVAQDLSGEPDVFSLDPIEVRMDDPAGLAADRATAAYVSEADLERSRMGDLKDLFAGIASVSVGGAIPVAQKIFVNGVDMLNLTVAVDGVLQSNRAFHHVAANAFDPGVLKSIRIDPGIAAADTGPNALAGAVIMETVDAADVLAEGDNFGGTVRLSYGDNGSTFGRSLTLSGRAEGFEVLAYAKSITGDDYVDGSGDTVEGTAADMQSVLLKFAYESDQGHRIELSGQQITDNALRPYRANIGEVIGGRVEPKTRIYETERQSFSLRYENTQGSDMWDPEAVLGYSVSSIDVPDPYQSEGKSSTLSGKIQNTFHLSSINTVVAGLDFYNKESEYNDPIDNGLNEAADNIGIFAQARFEPTDDLKISAGLRYDWQDFTGIGGYEDSVSGASGNASVTYFLTESFSLRAGYSNVFGGLQLEDNYEFWRRWDYVGLRPSRSENYTIGFDWVQSNNFAIGGEYFLTQINDVRDGQDNFDFESEGYNLGASYGWADGFMRLTYSTSDVTVDGSAAGSYDALDLGAPLGQILAFEVQQSLPQWNMLVGGSLDMAFDYDGTEGSSDQALNGYQVVNLFAEYAPPTLPGVTFRASVYNLFDQTYADRATYGADYIDIVPLNEPGRTLVVEAVARF